ncbi:unnamed protein product [Amoebophrya sp. A25]|nr:unnamed protein product [Amoebophrya sp. A25]|eukprot:GSA25T00001779001.1
MASSSSVQNLSRIPISPMDTISAIRFHEEVGNPHFAVMSWDCKGYLYRADDGSLLQKFPSNFPLTDCAWMDSTRLCATSLDARITIIDTRTNQAVAQADRAHESTIRRVVKLDSTTIITGGWDKKVKMWDTRTMKNVATGNVNAKVFCMDVTHADRSSPKLVVGGSDKHIHIFDYGNGITKLEERESALKYQLRSIACMPDGQGFVQGSVEGRASWDYFAEDMQKGKFAFKCHREPGANGMEQIHPVHDIAFHPIHHTFATVGGDGTLCMWDGTCKKRIWKTSKFDDEITSLSFSADGRYLAMAVGSHEANGPKEVWIKFLQDSEVMQRGSQKTR